MRKRPPCPPPHGALRINLVSLVIYILLIIGAYAGYAFLPVWWETQEMKNIMGEVAISAGRSSDADMKDKLWSLLQANFKLEIPKERIRIWRKNEHVHIEITYQRRISHFWGRESVLTLKPHVERIIL